MTGSGGSVFATFADEASARVALGQVPPDMQGFVARGLDRHPLYDG
jgi:4-diphosphocytidyl-2-C-methyl-D-erythritol kinase